MAVVYVRKKRKWRKTQSPMTDSFLRLLSLFATTVWFEMLLIPPKPEGAEARRYGALQLRLLSALGRNDAILLPRESRE
jgi:hypothetical protein